MFPDDTWEQAGISWEFDGVLTVYCLSCNVSAVVVYQSLYEKNSGLIFPGIIRRYCPQIFAKNSAVNKQPILLWSDVARDLDYRYNYYM